MIIEQGYWNYFIAFQLDSMRAMTKCVKRGKLNRSVLAICQEEHYNINPLFDNNPLEELNDYIDNNINVLKDTVDNVIHIHGKQLQDNAIFALTVPIVMTTMQNKDIVCPTMLYLLSSGLGVVKVRVPINSVDSKCFASMPTKKWYKKVRLPQYLKEGAGYVEADASNNSALEDFNELLFGIVITAFEGYIKSKDQICCFENITLLKVKEPKIEGQEFRNNKGKLTQLFYVKESCGHTFDKFGETVNICGKSIMSCRPARVITFGSIETIKECMQVEGTISDIELLENCVQNSFDWTICLALWKKVNEIVCLMISAQKSANISKSIAKYNMIQHELDAMLDTSSYLIKKVYQLVIDNIEYEAGNNDYRIKRMGMIDDYGEKQSARFRSICFNLIMLFFTCLFGIPAIKETIFIIAGPPSKDTIPELDQTIANLLSLKILGIVSIIIFGILIWNVVEYFSRKVR